MSEAPGCFTTHSVENSVQVIRNKLRQTLDTNRKCSRNSKVNRFRRAALGQKFNDSVTLNWTLDEVLLKAKELKRKSLSVEDYKKLEVALLQGEEYIESFMTVDQILLALIRDLSNLNPEIQLLALHCCNNISLGNSNACSVLCKFAGPYLIMQLETCNNPLLEACAWTVGNLYRSNFKAVHETLQALGCSNRLLSLLESTQTTVFLSIAYAVTHYLYESSISKLGSESDFVRAAQIVTERLPCEEFKSSECLWLLALLSSIPSLSNSLLTITSKILEYLIRAVEVLEELPICRVKEISALIRILANLSSEESGFAADIILTEKEAYDSLTFQILFNKLLSHPCTHVRKETLWLIGNLYNHSSFLIRRLIRQRIHLLDFQPTIK